MGQRWLLGASKPQLLDLGVGLWEELHERSKPLTYSNVDFKAAAQSISESALLVEK